MLVDGKIVHIHDIRFVSGRYEYKCFIPNQNNSLNTTWHPEIDLICSNQEPQFLKDRIFYDSFFNFIHLLICLYLSRRRSHILQTSLST